MSNHKKSLIICAVLFSVIAIQGTAIAQTEAQLQEKFTSYLNSIDMFSRVDDDGDVQFQQDGKTYFIQVDEDDPLYFRLVLANVWPIENEAERERVIRAVDIANRKIKVAKIFTVNDNVWVGVEGFMSGPDDYEAYFSRSLNVINGCIEHFREAMNE